MSQPEPAQGAHLLIVDDDDRIRELLKRFLSRHGHLVSAAADAAQARRIMDSIQFDLLIVDVMMPGEDGFSLASSIRKGSDVPILMLSARGEPGDRIAGFEAGIDDYVPKPFEPEELVLRVGAILRRAAARKPAKGALVQFGSIVFDAERGLLERDGHVLKLTESEVALMRLLASRPGEPFSREELAKVASAGMERAIDVQVTRLRRKIEDNPHEPIWLQTVRGIGYRLVIG